MELDPKPVLQLNCLSGPWGSQTYRLPFGPTFGKQDARGIHFGFGARTKNSVGMEQRGVNVAQSRGLPGVSLLTLLRQGWGVWWEGVCKETT